MKLLLFSDLHADADAARRLVALAGRADLLVGAGDFCNAHRDLPRCIGVLRQAGKPAVLVAGNHETTDELAAACRDWPEARVLHGGAATVRGVTFFGLGGAVPVTPFGAWSHDLSEEEAARLLEGCPAGCVLVSHSPPRGAADLSSGGRHLGSVSVRGAVGRLAPVLVVCGHIHGSAGQQAMLGTTPVVNAGPAGVVWELSEGPA